MTNADVIRKMTDEQLFEFLSEWEVGDIDYSITFCDLCMESKREGGKGNELGLDCDGCREHWLKRDAVDYSGLLYWKKNTTYGERGRGMIGEEVIAYYGDAGDGEELFEKSKLVRCKDCLHYTQRTEHTGICDFWNAGVAFKDFCSMANQESMLERIDNE